MKSELQNILEVILKGGGYNFKIIEYRDSILDKDEPSCLAITTPYSNSLDPIKLGIEIGRISKRPINIRTSYRPYGMGRVWFWLDIPYVA